MPVGPSKCLKQIIRIERNRVKNPNWPEASQLAIYKYGREFELGTSYREQIQLAVRAGLELGASELQVRRFNHSATLFKSKMRETNIKFQVNGKIRVRKFGLKAHS